MEIIFFGKDGKIRVGWRAAAFLLAFFFVSYFLIVLSITIVSAIPFGGTPNGYLPLVIPFGLSAITAIVLGWGFGKLFEHLPFRSLGLSLIGKWFKDLALGCAIGAVAIGSAVVIGVMGGGIKLELNNLSSSEAIFKALLSTFWIFMIGALSEEALFRGYLLQTFVRSELSWAGILLTSILFTLAHGGNLNTGWLALTNTFLAGIWFAFAYLKTRSLWLPLGIHFTWNWLQGPFFGLNVSGFSELSADPILRATDNGPALLTGGSYGIEGGIACTIAIVISIAWIYFLPKSSEPTLSGS